MPSSLPTPNTPEIGSWVMVAALIINAIVGLGGLLAFFATRREMESVEKRVGTLELELRSMRDRTETDKTEMLAAGECRARRLHERMDDVRAELLAHTDTMRREVSDQLHQMPSRIIADLANFKHFGGTK